MLENPQQDMQKAIDIAVKFTEISGQLKSIDSKIESILFDMKSKHDELNAKIERADTALFQPKEGLYARVQILEDWKSTASKVLWIITTVIVGSGIAFIFDMIRK